MGVISLKRKTRKENFQCALVSWQSFDHPVREYFNAMLEKSNVVACIAATAIDVMDFVELITFHSQ